MGFHGGDLVVAHLLTGSGLCTVSSNRLYGTSSAFWESGNGTVFAINTDGTGFVTLHNFSPPIHDPDTDAYTNSDGAVPMAALTSSGSRLYGTAYKGGSFGLGTVFAVNTDGSDFTTLHSFDSNAAKPWAGLLLAGLPPLAGLELFFL